MTTPPPAEGFETKNYPGAIPGRPGYQLADQPAPEHGEGGLQYGYSNSPGNEGDDGKSVFDSDASGTASSSGDAEGDGAKDESGASGSTTKRTSTTTKSSGSK